MTSRALRRHIGQLVIAGFSGHTLPREVRDIARDFDLGGVILFARNIDEPAQVADLTRECALLAIDWPLWISVDQEGGRVARLRSPFTEWPPMATLGRSGDEGLAVRFARALAREVKAIGFNMDFAPVLDVHTNPSNPVIGDRALSEKAEDVARLGAAIIRTLQAEGIAACGKHFPGHGDTSTDSHLELPLVEQPPDRLEAVEFVPFKAAIEADVAAIMTAHVLVLSLDDSRPASLSPTVLNRLRRGLQFDGLIISDDLDMRAISAHYPLEHAIVAAVAAGCDLVLLCGDEPARHVAALEALIHAVEDEQLPRKRVDEAIARQRRAKERFLAPPRGATVIRPPWGSIVGSGEHQAIAAEMARYL